MLVTSTAILPLQGTCWWFESIPLPLPHVVGCGKSTEHVCVLYCKLILWVQILLGQLCGACSNHLDITVNYENQKHHEKIYGTLTAIYFLNKILGEYFIIYFIFCVHERRKNRIFANAERRKQVYKN